MPIVLCCRSPRAPSIWRIVSRNGRLADCCWWIVKAYGYRTVESMISQRRSRLEPFETENLFSSVNAFLEQRISAQLPDLLHYESSQYQRRCIYLVSDWSLTTPLTADRWDIDRRVSVCFKGNEISFSLTFEQGVTREQGRWNDENLNTLFVCFDTFFQLTIFGGPELRRPDPASIYPLLGDSSQMRLLLPLFLRFSQLLLKCYSPPYPPCTRKLFCIVEFFEAAFFTPVLNEFWITRQKIHILFK